jgi:kynurenine formamidase
MYTKYLLLIFILTFVNVHAQEEKKVMFEDCTFIDLTHALNGNVPTWDGSCGFYLKMKYDYADCQTETKFRLHQVDMKAGIGTHMDAPHHCFLEGVSIDRIALNQLIIPAVVINVADRADENYQLSVEEIQRFETEYGTIPSNSLVLIHTGWSRFWHDPAQYRNVDSQGWMHFPSISEEAAQYLTNRHVVGIAIDTLSPDIPSSDYPVHRLILGSGKYIIENIVNADQLPPYGAYVMALPLKIEKGTEAPLRVIGIVPAH